MKMYKLNRYNHWDEDGGYVCFEDVNAEIVANKALELCGLDKPNTYTYRMETWEGNQMIGEWRFFQDGREFTQDIIKAVLQ
jgi:hypothetical protein